MHEYTKYLKPILHEKNKILKTWLAQIYKVLIPIKKLLPKENTRNYH